MGKGLPFKAFLNQKANFEGNNLIIAGEQVMQRWETPAMKLIADVVSEKGGRILEIGLGLGISAGFVQANNPKEHIIIEAHPDVIAYGEKLFAKELKDSKMKIIKGMWHEVMPKLEENSFDGILFDAHIFSVMEKKIQDEYFFKMAFRLLKSGGVLSVFSQFDGQSFPKLADYCKKQGFGKVSYKTCKVEPSEDCKYWTSKTALIPVIVK